jgi:small GTP-binding protein
MILMKVCLLGSFAVGKTSLATRFTESSFSDRYHTTVGVRIHKREVDLDGVELKIVVWDLAGEDELVKLRVAYLRGSSGYILVADATRRETIHVALRLKATAEEAIGAVPCILAVNKLDLVDEAAAQKIREELNGTGLDLRWTSCKTGDGVDQAFLALARKMMQGVRA